MSNVTRKPKAPEEFATRDARRLRRLLDAGRLLTAELDPDVVLEHVLSTARELTGARYAAVGVLDAERRSLVDFVTSGADPGMREAIGELPRGRGLLGLLIDDPRPIRLREVADHPRSFGFPPGHPPMHSFLGVPILIRGQAWGNLYLTDKQGAEEFDEADEEDVGVLAAWAAIAIDNAVLFRAGEQRRTELERAVAGMEASMVVAEAVGSDLELDRALELIVKRGRSLVAADALAIWLCEGEELRLVAHAGTGAHTLGVRLPRQGSTVGRALKQGRVIRIDDLTAAEIAPDDELHAARSALVVPLTFRGQQLGALVAVDHLGERPAFGLGDERALRSFAASAATAVTTARSVSAQRLRDSLEAAEVERKRWAHELHDQTLQGLGGLRLTLAAAARAQPNAAQELIGDAVEQLTGEITALRSIVSALRPAALDELGLEPALRSLGDETSKRAGIVVDLRLRLGAERLAPAVETTVYRIVQEALTNVAKHSEASAATVDVAAAEGTATVRVRDDGRGMNVDAQADRRGFGLIGMRERAELAGGHLNVVSGERGTTVELLLPLG